MTSLVHNAQSTINFVGLGSPIDGVQSKINFLAVPAGQTNPGDVRNIIPYATVTEPDRATGLGQLQRRSPAPASSPCRPRAM